MSRDKAEIIAYAIRKECQKCNWYETWGITFDEFEEFLSNGIKGIEKQIPKKPDCIEDKMWCCPVCDNNLLHKWIKYPTRLMPKSEGLPYCMSCGQAIDWSEQLSLYEIEHGRNFKGNKNAR